MKDETLPIKRHKTIQFFSKDHKVVSLLGWKIRQGFKKEIELERIKDYADWIFENQIRPHFYEEEKYIFSLLDDDDKLKKRAISEHRKLERLFADGKDINRALSLIEELLDLNISFEERILYDHIQEVASEEQLKKLEDHHKNLIRKGFWKDRFWEQT